MRKEVLQEALELLAVATFITPKLQAKRTDVINAGLQSLAEQPAQQGPMASVRTWHKNGVQHAELDDWGLAIALLPDGKHELYTSPPAQRTWVGLTETEINDITCGMVKGWVMERLVDAIEAKLKEKNT